MQSNSYLLEYTCLNCRTTHRVRIRDRYDVPQDVDEMAPIKVLDRNGKAPKKVTLTREPELINISRIILSHLSPIKFKSALEIFQRIVLTNQNYQSSLTVENISRCLDILKKAGIVENKLLEKENDYCDTWRLAGKPIVYENYYLHGSVYQGLRKTR